MIKKKESIWFVANRKTLSGGGALQFSSGESRTCRGAEILNTDANWVNFKISKRDNQTHGRMSQFASVAILSKSD